MTMKKVIESITVDRNMSIRQLVDEMKKETNWKKYLDKTVLIDDEVEFLVELRVTKKDVQT